MNITGDPQADALLDSDPFALLLGMLLDQQIPMEKAFTGPALLAQRLGVGRLTPSLLADLDPERLAAVMAGPPAVHRYHNAFTERVAALAAAVFERYGDDASQLWTTAGTGAELLARLKALPGFGEQKAKIFVALLGKQRGVTPPGWREAAGAYADPGTHRSVADVVDRPSLLAVREFKKAAKAAAKSGS